MTGYEEARFFISAIVCGLALFAVVLAFIAPEDQLRLPLGLCGSSLAAVSALWQWGP